MSKIPRILAGNYGAGSGVRGIKTSYAGYDVTVRADDQDTTRRSFNSEWSSLCKVKIIGAATQVYVPYQARDVVYQVSNASGYNIYYTTSRSMTGWQLLPIEVLTGLNYMPVWEERCYEPDSGLIWDDRAKVSFSDDYLWVYGIGYAHYYGDHCFSGARSWFAGPGAPTANTINLEPWDRNSLVGQAIPSQLVVNTNANTDLSEGGYPAPRYPGYPTAPPYPSTAIPYCAYAIYTNKLGDIS